jgi:hypothetical protein
MGNLSDVVLQLLPSPGPWKANLFRFRPSQPMPPGGQLVVTRSASYFQKKEIRKQREDTNSASHGPSSRFARLEKGALDRTGGVIDRSPLFPSRSFAHCREW